MSKQDTSIKAVCGDRIQLDIEEPKAGDLSLGSYQVAVEYGTVIGIGPDVVGIKIGDKVLFKAWGVDIISYDNKRYYFTSQAARAIEAILKWPTYDLRWIF